MSPNSNSSSKSIKCSASPEPQLSTLTSPHSCRICQPPADFSTKSQLLAHLGSRPHLANYHKLDLSSDYDAGATNQLAGFRDWYVRHGVRALLVNRLREGEEDEEEEEDEESMDEEVQPRAANKKQQEKNPGLVDSPSSRYSLRSRQPNPEPAQEPDNEHEPTFERRIEHGERHNVRPQPGASKTSPRTRKKKSVGRSRSYMAKEENLVDGADVFDGGTPHQRKTRNQSKDDHAVNRRLLAASDESVPEEMIYSTTTDFTLTRSFDELEDELEQVSPDEKPPPAPTPRRRGPGRKPRKPRASRARKTPAAPAPSSAPDPASDFDAPNSPASDFASAPAPTSAPTLTQTPASTFAMTPALLSASDNYDDSSSHGASSNYQSDPLVRPQMTLIQAYEAERAEAAEVAAAAAARQAMAPATAVPYSPSLDPSIEALERELLDQEMWGDDDVSQWTLPDSYFDGSAEGQ